MKSKNPVTLVRNILITLYILVVLGFSATARAENVAFPIFIDRDAIEAQAYIGEVAVDVNGQAYLIISETKYFELMANGDLTEFNGARVQVEGIELKHKVGPVLKLQSMDPLPNRNVEKVTPVLVVLGISELPVK